jgi:hypothetical protein
MYQNRAFHGEPSKAFADLDQRLLHMSAKSLACHKIIFGAAHEL